MFQPTRCFLSISALLKMRLIASLAVLCCLVCFGSQPARAQTGETIYVSSFGGTQIVKIVDAATATTSVVNTHTGASPEDIVVGPDNKIYICDADQNRIRRVTQNGDVEEVVYDQSLNSNSTSACADGPCPTGPEGPSFSTTGDLYFNTRGPSGHTGVWKIPAGQLSPLPLGGAIPVNVVTAAQTGSTFGEGTAFDAQDNLLFVDRSGGKVWRFNVSTSTLVTPAIITGLNAPIGVAVNGDGDIFVSDFGTNRVKHYDANGNPVTASNNDFVTFTSPDAPIYLRFDASGNLFVVTGQDANADMGKVWRVNSSGTATLVVDLNTAAGLASNKALGLALPPTTFTTGQQALAPGTITTFTNGNISNQIAQIPPDAIMNDVAFAEVMFIQESPSDFITETTTFPDGVSHNDFSGGGNVSAAARCTPIAGTGGNCLKMVTFCFKADGITPVNPCSITRGPSGSPIELYTKYKTGVTQMHPALLIADDPPATNYADITNFFDPLDPKSGGGTVTGQQQIEVVELPGSLGTDTAPPTTTATIFPAPNGAGLNNTSVSVILTAVDDQFVKNITYSATGAQTIANTVVPAPSTFFPVKVAGQTVVSFFATDNAGNVETPAKTLTVNIIVYKVCLLYPANGAVKQGADFPIKMFLCDANGNDVSNSSIVVQATALVRVSGNTSGDTTITDTGNSNPDNNFRFDSTLGTTGGYIFNFKTTNLAKSSAYSLQFTVNGVSSPTYAVPLATR